MKRFLLASLAIGLLAGTAGAAPTAKSRGRIVDCTTPGDALGSIRVYYASMTKVVIAEQGMDGRTRTYAAASNADEWKAFSAGRDISFVSYAANAPMFGGAVSQASIITLHTRVGTQSKGFWTRNGTVYYLTCRN